MATKPERDEFAVVVVEEPIIARAVMLSSQLTLVEDSRLRSRDLEFGGGCQRFGERRWDYVFGEEANISS